MRNTNMLHMRGVGRHLAAALAATLMMAVSVTAAPMIDVGHHFLQPNQAGQAIDLYVTGGDMVSGLNLWVQVGDGGPERTLLGLDPGTAGPHITSIDIKTGTIFAGVTDEPVNNQVIPQLGDVSLALLGAVPSVAANGRLATVYFDTTGWTSGTWDLSLTNILDLGLDSDFAGISALITNGSIEILLSAIAGDFNGDGIVDADDLDLVLGYWGQSSVPASWVNYIPDGIVAADELDAVLGNWGNTSDPMVYMPAMMQTAGLSESQITSMIVPEPATGILLLAAGALMMPRRRAVAPRW